MAKPVQYIQQYVPTNFDLYNNLMGMYKQDLQQRQALADQTISAGLEAAGQLGALPTADIEGRQERLDYLNNAMEEAIQKRGGDPAAASKDIARIIMRERSNPWYQMNTQQQEFLKNKRQLGLNADNLLIGEGAKNLEEYQKAIAEGRDPYALSALSRKDVYARAKDIASNYANQIFENPEYSSILGGQYWEKIAQQGFTAENIDEFINSGEGSKIMESMLASYPELGEANESQLKEVIKQGLTGAIGKEEAKTLADQSYLSDRDKAYISAQQAKNQGGVRIGYAGQQYLAPSATILANSPTINKTAVELAKRYGLEGIETYNDLIEASQEVQVGEQKAQIGFGMQGSTPEMKGTPRADLAGKILQEITLETDKGLRIPKFNFKPLSTDAGDIRDFNTIKKQFDDLITDPYNIDKLKPVNDKDKKFLEEIQELEKDKASSSKLQITSFGYDPGNVSFAREDGIEESIQGYGSGLILEAKAKNKDGETITAQLLVPRDDLTGEIFEIDLMRYLTALSPEMAYIYANENKE